MVFIESTSETEETCELKKHLEDNSGPTTTMVDLAHLLFLMSDYDRTISFCQALLSEIPHNWALTARCYSIMAQAYQEHPLLALQFFENALELQLKYGPDDFQALAAMYNNMGCVYSHLGSAIPHIVDYYEKALQLCKVVSDESQLN